MTLLTDISKAVFYDNLYISSFTWDHSVILSRKDDTKHPQGSSLSDIFDAESQADIRKYLVSFVMKPLLCLSDLGPAIVFNFLYHSTLTVITSLPEIDINTALNYAKEKDAFIIADSLKERVFYNDETTDRSKYFILDRILESTHTPLLKAATFLPLSSNDILDDMLSQAKMLSEMCGCATEITKEGKLMHSSLERPAAETDFALYTAALTVLLLLARRFSADRSARISLCAKNESPFVTVSFDPLQNEEGRQTNSGRFTKELFDIHSVFQKLKALFYVADDRDSFSVCFSPVRTDWSLLGIKNGDSELIFDLDSPLCDG
jgi:hypothetical protein